MMDTEISEFPLNSPPSGTVSMPLFPSSSDYWKIPELDLNLQCSNTDLPLFKWGQAGRRGDLSGKLVHFYTEDRKFQALVENSSAVLQSGAAGAVEVNFSTDPFMSRALVLYKTFQKRWLSKRLQHAGIPLWVDLNVEAEFFDVNGIGVPFGWRSYAVRGYANDPAHIEQASEWALERANGAPLLFLCYGGGKALELLCSARGWHWRPDARDTLG